MLLRAAGALGGDRELGRRHGNGPGAIIEASGQVELYDREHDREPALDYGIHTLPALALADDPVRPSRRSPPRSRRPPPAGGSWSALGGEHTISAGVNHGLLEALGGPITVVQLDAHSDLRDEYEGTPFSHACVARRILEDPRVEQVLQLGCAPSTWRRWRSPARTQTGCASGTPRRSTTGSWREEFAHACADGAST